MTTAATEVANEAAVDRMAAELLRALVDEVRQAPAQWSKLTEVQQDMLIQRLRTTVRTETEKAILLVAGGKREVARVKIESLTAKEGVKCVLQVGADAQHEVLDYVGQKAVLVMCDPEQFFSGVDQIKPEKDQQDLPLGEGEAGERLTIDVAGEPDPIGETEAEEATEAATEDEAA